MSITKDQIIEAVAAMSVMDVVELISAMEEKFGVCCCCCSCSCWPG
jgi:large subunit ribosomal protein L7/L12